MTLPDTTFDPQSLCDELGPAKIVHLHEPSCGLRAIVVIDNVACGPAIGGLRMATDVSTTEVFRLARAMTLKNAAAGLAHGGGKSGIIADPKSSNKQRLIRAFARAIRDLREYIPGPDMGTDETSMALIHNEIGRAVGLPRVLGGIPLDELGATGFGLAHCGEVAAEFADIKLPGATMAIEGFGNVGRHAARFFADKGTKLVAASDSGGTIYEPRGIDVAVLIDVKNKTGSVTGFHGGQRLAQAALLSLPCDILIPAARPDCIRADNVREVKARLVLQGANIPATAEAEKLLHEMGVICVPDFIANAGGVIFAAVEYHQGTEGTAFEQVASKIRRNTHDVLTRSQTEKIHPRQAAVEFAKERVQQAMRYQITG